jgi:hypothetical protein
MIKDTLFGFLVYMSKYGWHISSAIHDLPKVPAYLDS